MLCQFERVIFPRDAAASTSGFMIAVYKPCGTLRDAAGQILDRFKAVGYCLPTSNKVKYRMEGHWSKTQKHGIQFEVERYEEVITPTKDGIIAYLASGQIRGIGKKTAEKIYETFGQETLQILDQEPRKLLTVKGISEKKLRKIIDSYLANRGARDVIAFLAPHGVTPNRAVKLYREYGEETMDIVRNHPYRLCELAGIAFKTADKLAMSMGIDPLSPERVDEALLYTLTDAEGKGHLCLEKHDFLKACLKLLDTVGMTEDMAAARAVRLIQDGKLVSYGDSVFKSKTARTEESLAYEIVRKMHGSVAEYPHLDYAIDQEERKLGFRLAPEQREAVKMGLTQKLCVITGGPGTGKTSVQKALLDLYKERYPAAKIACCAPTGKAARRMEQATGVRASTVHRALGLMANEDGQYGDPEMLEADLVLVDEVSMLDVYLAEKLFRSVADKSRLILVGDSDQLPSVGPGAVLKEIIASGLVPVVRLDQVFRQKNGSRIAANAKLIRHGNLSLEYGSDFEFYDSTDLSVSAEIIESLYLQETAKYGIDNVVLLSPYRQKTETGANALNQRLQGKINPPMDGKSDAVHGQRRFRTGDKVMQIKNCEDINNGDIGYIKSITGTQSDSVVRIDFGDGRIVDYENSDLDMLDLGYACTVHKSQGSEYKSVIINLQCAHSVMLVRPLIYTAITRAKEKVLIVGERRALCTSIRRIDTERVIRNASVDAFRASRRKQKTEMDIDDPMVAYIHSIQTHDTYTLYSRTFYVKNQPITVREKYLGEALQYIIPQKRAVILLSYFEGYNDTEVANILGVSQTSIARRKKSALMRLRELMEVRSNDE